MSFARSALNQLVLGTDKTSLRSPLDHSSSLGVAEKRDSDHPSPTPKESKNDAPGSTTTMVIKLSHFNKEDVTAIDALLPHSLHTLILSYLDVNVADSHRVDLICERIAFLFYLSELYAKGITHNLLWHLHMDETLAWAKQNASCLTDVVRLKCPNAQAIEATPLEVLIAAGERNPRELKAGEKNYGLAEDLGECLDPAEVKKQSAAWYSHPDFQKETDITMAPYIQAIKELCQGLIDCKDIPVNPTEEEFQRLVRELPCAVKFHKAFKPDSKHVVKKTGLLFGLKIFDTSDAIWVANIIELGGWGSTKSNLFGTIVERALQGRCQRTAVGIFSAGIGHVARPDGIIPKRLDYTDGVPAELKDAALGDFGSDFCFLFFGGMSPRSEIIWGGAAECVGLARRILCQATTSALELNPASKISTP